MNAEGKGHFEHIKSRSHPTPNEEWLIARLEAEAQENERLRTAKYPGCKVLSLGDACTCKLCTLERAAEAAEVRCAAPLELLREARDALRDFGRHNQGCSGDFPQHKCKCGWERDAVPLLVRLDAHLSQAGEKNI